MNNHWLHRVFPFFFGSIVLMIVAVLALAVIAAVKVGREVDSNGGIGRSIGRFIGEVQKGMEE